MIRNIRHWIDVVRLDKDSKVLIICDDAAVKSRVLEAITGLSEDDFIESNRIANELVEITKNNTSDVWNNASYSHLTTFYDAKMRNIKRFWNIDADDTCFCMKPDRVLEILKEAEKYADANNIHAFSFDMSRSRRNGTFWSFGVTYINNEVDWINQLMEHCYDDYRKHEKYKSLNLAECIDSYFTYLDECSDLNMSTFYVENCKFVHYSNDFVYRPWCSWFATYKSGRIIKPLLKDFYGLESIGDVPVYEDVVKLDINLTDNEQTEWLINRAAENPKNKEILLSSLQKNLEVYK